jgi:hypothetical protein
MISSVMSVHFNLLVIFCSWIINQALLDCFSTLPDLEFTNSFAEPPSIDPFRFPKRKQGERVRVTCFVSRGDSPMTIMWCKDGEEIPPDLGVVIRVSDYTFFFYFQKIR